MDDSYRERKMYVDVRVGSYDFVNLGPEEYNFFSRGRGSSYSYIAHKDTPINDTALVLRTSPLLVMDKKYKAVLFQFLIWTETPAGQRRTKRSSCIIMTKARGYGLKYGKTSVRA